MSTAGMMEIAAPQYGYYDLFGTHAWACSDLGAATASAESLPAEEAAAIAGDHAAEAMGDRWVEGPTGPIPAPTPPSKAIPLFDPATMDRLDANLRYLWSDRRFEANPDIVETLHELCAAVIPSTTDAEGSAMAATVALITALCDHPHINLILGGRGGFKDGANAGRFEHLIAAMAAPVIAYLGDQSRSPLTPAEARKMIGIWVSHCEVGAGPLRTARHNEALRAAGLEAPAMSLYQLMSGALGSDAAPADVTAVDIEKEARELLDGLLVRLEVTRRPAKPAAVSPLRARAESGLIGLALRVFALFTNLRRR